MSPQVRILQFAARGLNSTWNYPGILQHSRSREDSGHVRERRERGPRNADGLQLHHFCGSAGSFSGIPGGPDRKLAAVLSKTKAVGLCTIAGDHSFDVAFIQMVVTPTGREITFIANRPLQSDEVNLNSDSQSFDLMVGQFDMNDTDNTKSTGFLYPASRLLMDEQGEFHYDLAGSPWSLVNVLDSNWAPALAVGEAPDATGPPLRPSLP